MILNSEDEKISELTGRELIVIPNTNHTFDSSHPWSSVALHLALVKVCKTTLSFIANHKRT